MVIGLILTILGLILTIGIAWQQHRRAVQAESKLKNALKDIPYQVVKAIEKINKAAPEIIKSAFDELGGKLHVIEYLDIDGDGEKELLIQYPAGIHGSALKIFDWHDFEFQEVGDLRSDTPSGFEFFDYDSDGKIEIFSAETDWKPDLCYAESSRFHVVYRWNGKEFVEILRHHENDCDKKCPFIETNKYVT